MEFKQILAKSFRDYKNNPLFILPRFIELLADSLILLIFFVIIVAAGLILGPVSYEAFILLNLKMPFYLIALGIIILSLAVFLLMLVSASVRAALINMAMGADMREKTTLQEGWIGVKNYAPRIFLYFVFLVSVLLGMLGLTVILLTIFGDGRGFGPIIAFFFLSFSIIGFLLVYLFTLFTPQEIAVRDTGVIDGLKASAAFVRGNFWTVGAYGGVIFALSLGVGFFISLIFFIINEVTRYNSFLNLAAKIFHNILALTVGLIISPYFEIVKTYMVIQGETHGRTGRDKEEKNEGITGEDDGTYTPK